MENKTLDIFDIYLDGINPRHNLMDDQSEIISHLVKNDKIKGLARDIATNGLSPLDLIAVTKDVKGHYIVLEGNRRVCALLLLNDPKRAPASEITYFKKLIGDPFNIPRNIKCLVFERREDAHLWIERRHSGEQEGIGTRQWNAEEKTRYNAILEKPDTNALAQKILTYAVDNSLISIEQKDKILTTATRYLGNPFFRKTLGIISSRSDHNVEINVPLEEFSHVIHRFCADLVDPESGVNSRTTKNDWESYARKLSSENIAPSSTSEPYKLFSASKIIESGKEGDLIENNKSFIALEPKDYDLTKSAPILDSSNAISSEQPKNDQSFDFKKVLQPKDALNSHEGESSNSRGEVGGNTQDPNKRKYLISSQFRVPISNNILRRVFGELKSIEVAEQPLAVALLARAFLENLYAEYYFVIEGRYPADKMKKHLIILKIIGYLEKQEINESLSKPEKNGLGALKQLQQKNTHPFNPNTLGANAHAGIYPIAKDLLIEWDNLTPILLYMLKHR